MSKFKLKHIGEEFWEDVEIEIQNGPAVRLTRKDLQELVKEGKDYLEKSVQPFIVETNSTYDFNMAHHHRRDKWYLVKNRKTGIYYASFAVNDYTSAETQAKKYAAQLNREYKNVHMEEYLKEVDE